MNNANVKLLINYTNLQESFKYIGLRETILEKYFQKLF